MYTSNFMIACDDDDINDDGDNDEGLDDDIGI
jgi:hypothetical protein